MNAHADPIIPIAPVSKATLPALAKAIALWFPELQGRSLAVSEAKITRDNIPTLPLVMVSLLRETGGHSVGSTRIEPEEQIVVEFWFKPERYVMNNGGESPFWAFYDYDTLRDRLVANLKYWFTPRGNRLEYFALDVDSDQFATTITFQLRHKFVFCDPEDFVEPCEPSTMKDGQPFKILLNLCTPKAYCEELSEPVVDPCEPGSAQQP